MKKIDVYRLENLESVLITHESVEKGFNSRVFIIYFCIIADGVSPPSECEEMTREQNLSLPANNDILGRLTEITAQRLRSGIAPIGFSAPFQLRLAQNR